MSAFDKEKSEELSRLYEGHDLSPKGSIDLPCLDLVNFINEELCDYVTTSSCSGRISIYQDNADESKGVHWLLVKHGCLSKDLLLSCIARAKATGGGRAAAEEAGQENGQIAPSMTLKCEGMILHCKCRDVTSAARLHQVSLAAGYREGGITIGKHHIMLAIRTTAYTLEAPLSAAGVLLPLPFLEVLLAQANRRMVQNTLRLGKFLRMLKEFFGFPVLFPMSPRPGEGRSSISRTGLAAALVAGDVLCLGGQGSSRSLPAMVYGGGDGSHRQIDGEVMKPVHGVMLTLPCKIFGHVVLISGGRCSPKDSLPCLAALYRYTSTDLTGGSRLEPITFDETGDAPARRWGHSVVHLEHFSNGREKGLGDDVDNKEAVYMLYGGRDVHQVYSDCYLLTLRGGTSGFIAAAWRRLQLRSREGIGALVPSAVLLDNDDDVALADDIGGAGVEGVDAEPQPRFFHACSLLPNAFDSSSPLVLLHGGLHNLNSDASSSSSSSSSSLIVVNPKCNSWSRVACTGQRRFAHALIEVGFGTYLLVGGVYSGESVEHGAQAERKSFAKLEVSWHEDRGWVGEESAVKIMMPHDDGQGTQGGQFPCHDCRCHFQAMMVPTDPLHSRKSALLLLGGGASAGFGMHLCQDARARIGCIHDEMIGSMDGGRHRKEPLSSDRGVSPIPKISDHKPSSMKALVVCATSAHRVKMYLESNGWLDKTTRIGNFDPGMEGAKDRRLSIQIEQTLLACLQTEADETVVAVDNDGSLGELRNSAGDSAEMLKAIPVSPAFLTTFVSSDSPSSSAVGGLYRAMYPRTRPTNDATLTLHLTPLAFSQHSRPSHSALMTMQRQSRLRTALAVLRRIVHLCCGAGDFFPDETENEEVGVKFEIVGGSEGVVMIPEGLVQELVVEATRKVAASCAVEIEEDALEQLWRDFLANFSGPVARTTRKPTRVAYKQRIALGPRRESQIRLLYPIPESDSDELESPPSPPHAPFPRLLRGWRPKMTGPGRPGWTHLTENEIGS